MKVRNKITSYLSGLNEKQIQDIDMVVKTILQESLQRACRSVYESGSDKDVVVKIFNEMMREVRNG